MDDGLVGGVSPSRLRKSHFGSAEQQRPVRLGQAWSIWLSGLSDPSGCLMQPNKPDRPNRPNEQDRLADFFSILLGSDRRRDRLEVTQLARVAGAERMDLLYSEGGGEFHSDVRVFLRHLA